MLGSENPREQYKERLIVALDVPSAEAALKLISQLGGLVSFYKVGLELFVAAGPDFVKALVSQGLRVFLDLKFLDIGETVRHATRSAARLGATFLSVHESGEAVSAAVLGAQKSDLKILAVSVLTSLSGSDLQEMGFRITVEELVMKRAKRALAAGAQGIIASGQEARQIRAAVDDEAIIVTPGIRPANAAANDQKRATTPREAILAGADYLVVGRPIKDAPDPHAATVHILEEMKDAFTERIPKRRKPAAF